MMAEPLEKRYDLSAIHVGANIKCGPHLTKTNLYLCPSLSYTQHTTSTVAIIQRIFHYYRYEVFNSPRYLRATVYVDK